MTTIILLEGYELKNYGKGTKYTAIVLHANQENRKRHEDMGFHEGWSTCLDRRVAMIKKQYKII